VQVAFQATVPAVQQTAVSAQAATVNSSTVSTAIQEVYAADTTIQTGVNVNSVATVAAVTPPVILTSAPTTAPTAPPTTAPPTTASTSSSSSSNIGLIIGLAVGGGVLLILGVCLVVFVKRRSSRDQAVSGAAVGLQASKLNSNYLDLEDKEQGNMAAVDPLGAFHSDDLEHSSAMHVSGTEMSEVVVTVPKSQPKENKRDGTVNAAMAELERTGSSLQKPDEELTAGLADLDFDSDEDTIEK